MDDTDKNYLESIMKQKHNDVSKLISVEMTPAVQDGENFVSKIYRLSVLALTKDNKRKQLSVILKKKVELDVKEEHIKEKISEAFNIEYRVYVNILPKLKRYLSEEGIQLWPECLGTLSDKDIYFEDLKVGGYKLADRQTGLDFDHSLMMFESLAKFHATSYIAIDRGEIDVTPYKNYLMLGSATEEHRHKTNEFELMTDVILNDWGIEWKDVADRLNEYKDSLVHTAHGLGNFDKERLNVFSHGDTWVNNFMFKYDSSGKLDSVKFVDFQIVHYNSFGFDLCYLLNTSVDSEVKKKHIDTLIDAYCKAFGEILDSNSAPLARPTPDMVKAELIRLAPVCLQVALRVRPVIMAPPQLHLTIPEMMKDSEEVYQKKRKIYANPNYVRIMKSDLPKLLSDVESQYKS